MPDVVSTSAAEPPPAAPRHTSEGTTVTARLLRPVTRGARQRVLPVVHA